MRSKKMLKKAGTGSIPNAFINIIGRNMLQNELLLSFLKKQTGLKGICFPTLESITPIDANKSVIPRLIILDCKNVDMNNLWTSLHDWDRPKTCQCFFVLCNAEVDSGIEKTAVDNGVQGIFYNNESLQLITKGVCSVLKGDLWYSRKVLRKCLLVSRSSGNASIHPSTSGLTYREKELLFYIASGYTSKDISDNLNISLHTVKTHIYNIYKKINATNRLQATLWAAKFL
ncbi:MAG: response regulator transcription factor [Desulfobacterales bacterium]|jgi:LuxR family transcriptional regulator of csgAB operon